MAKAKTQKEQVRAFINRHGSITTMQAFQELGITRLSARIADLIADGYTLKKTPVKHKLPSGKVTTITRYSNIRRQK